MRALFEGAPGLIAATEDGAVLVVLATSSLNMSNLTWKFASLSFQSSHRFRLKLDGRPLPFMVGGVSTMKSKRVDASTAI